MSNWNSNTCNYKKNYNKPCVSHNKTHKGNFKRVCNDCLCLDKHTNKEEQKIICNKPICPDIIDIIKDCKVYRPIFKKNIDHYCSNNKVKDKCHKRDKCHKVGKCHKGDENKLDNFIKMLTEKIIDV